MLKKIISLLILSLLLTHPTHAQQQNCTALGNEGYTLEQQAKYPEALQKDEAALACTRQNHDRKGEGTTLNNIGWVYQKQAKYEQAIPYFEQAIAIMESRRGTLERDDFKTSFIGQYMSAYRGMISVLVAQNEPLEAFHYVQRAKSRTFLEQLHGQPLSVARVSAT